MAAFPLVPYFTTSRYRVDTMVELSEIKSGEKVADLGSGDGRIAIAFAQAGGQVTGYELDDTLLASSKAFIHTLHLSEKITLKKSNFWEEDLSTFDVVAIYPMPDIMSQLEKKLLKETKPGARILTNYYPLPTWKAEKSKDHIYLYQKIK